MSGREIRCATVSLWNIGRREDKHHRLSGGVLEPSHGGTYVLRQDGRKQPNRLFSWTDAHVYRAGCTGGEQGVHRLLPGHTDLVIEEAFSIPAIGTERGQWA